MIHITSLLAEDTEVIDFIKKRLSQKWNRTEEDIENTWINPSFSSNQLPAWFIAREGDTFVGKICVYTDPKGYLGIENQPWILALYVEPGFRRRGIAQMLIEKVKELVRRAGYDFLYLDTADALGYYQKIGGWELMGEDWWELKDQTLFIMKTSL